MDFRHFATLGIGLLLSVAVVNLFGLDQTLAELAHANYGIIFLAAAVQGIVLLSYIARIKAITAGRGYLSYAQATRLTFSGMFVSMLTPLAKLGGEPLKMYMLGRGIGGQNASASIALESVMEVLSSFVIVLAVMAIYFFVIPAAFVSTFLIFIAVMGAAICIMMKILFTPRWLNRIIKWTSTKLAGLMEVKKKDYTDIFTTAFYEMWKEKTTVGSAFGISILSKIIEMLRFWLIFIALDAYLPFHTVVLVWTILLVILFIPWLPGSLGLAELGGISALIAFGVQPGVAASAIVIDRLLSFWIPLAIGAMALSWSKQKGELPDLKWKKQHQPGPDEASNKNIPKTV